MKKHNAKKLALRTETVATLTTDDLRKVEGGTATVVGFTTQLNTGFTSQLSNAGWTTIIIHG